MFSGRLRHSCDESPIPHESKTLPSFLFTKRFQVQVLCLGRIRTIVAPIRETSPQNSQVLVTVRWAFVFLIQKLVVSSAFTDVNFQYPIYRWWRTSYSQPILPMRFSYSLKSLRVHFKKLLATSSKFFLRSCRQSGYRHNRSWPYS
jgi:hypothetical protein